MKFLMDIIGGVRDKCEVCLDDIHPDRGENASQLNKMIKRVVTIIRNFHNSSDLSVHLSLCTNAERKEAHLGANCNYGQNIENIGRIDYGRIGEYCFENIENLWTKH